MRAVSFARALLPFAGGTVDFSVLVLRGEVVKFVVACSDVAFFEGVFGLELWLG